MAEELYTDFYDQLLGWCTARVRSPAAAEDLVQETFLRAMDRLEDLEPLNRAQRRAWLYRTAKNLAVDRGRRQDRGAPAEGGPLPGTTPRSWGICLICPRPRSAPGWPRPGGSW